MRILVVEDHRETRRMLESILKREGYAPVLAANLAEARDCLVSGGIGAVVLDWMLPDGPGPELCAELRAMKDPIPVLLLTARTAVEDRVAGLDAGADDYLKKPFAAAELLARVRALLRRGPRLVGSELEYGTVKLRTAERVATARGNELPLTAREFDILEMLVRHRGRVVSRSNLLIAVWGDDGESAAESCAVLLARLRRKLAEAGAPDAIRTHRGLGYAMELAE